MSIESRTSQNKTDIDAIETQLKAEGYKQVSASHNLQPCEYFRNEWSGTEKSFEGPKSFHIEWCKPE